MIQLLLNEWQAALRYIGFFVSGSSAQETLFVRRATEEDRILFGICELHLRGGLNWRGGSGHYKPVVDGGQFVADIPGAPGISVVVFGKIISQVYLTDGRIVLPIRRRSGELERLHWSVHESVFHTDRPGQDFCREYNNEERKIVDTVLAALA